MGCPTIHPSIHLKMCPKDGTAKRKMALKSHARVSQSGQKKKVRHSITVRFDVRLNRTVIQYVGTGPVFRGRGAVAGCGVHVPRLASPRSTAVVTDSLAVHSAGARAHAAQPARRLCGVALPVTVHESDLTFLPRAGSFCHPLPLHVRVPLSASDGSRHPNDGGACASQGLLHTAFASRAREIYRTQ